MRGARPILEIISTSDGHHITSDSEEGVGGLGRADLYQLPQSSRSTLAGSEQHRSCREGVGFCRQCGAADGGEAVPLQWLQIWQRQRERIGPPISMG